MGPLSSPQATQLMHLADRGDAEAARRLFEAVSDELRQIASRHFARQSPGHTLQPTALVNEAFVKMLGGEGVAVKDRAHFLALASRVMRQVLVDHARRRPGGHRELQGAEDLRLALAGLAGSAGPVDSDLIDLDDALRQLEALDPRKARLVELRFFGGLDEAEAAEALRISRTQAARDWKFARAWLIAALGRGGPATGAAPGTDGRP